MVGSGLKYLVTGVLMALIGLSVLPVAGAAEYVPQATSNNALGSNLTVTVNFTEVAETLISRTESLLAWVKGTIHQYGITLPQGLNQSLSKAEEALTNASDLALTNPKEAVAEVFKATHLLMPVVQYVSTVVPPEYKEVVTAWKLQAAIKVRQDILNHFERALQYLENRSVSVPPQVSNGTARAEELLNQARQALSSGNLSGAEALLKQVDSVMKQLRVELYRSMAHKWRSAVAAEAALKNFGLAVPHLVSLMNRSLTMLEQNRTSEAEVALSALAAFSGGMLGRLNYIEERINASSGTPQLVLNGTRYVLMTIHASALKALQALRAGNVTAAIAVLQDGLSKVKEVIGALGMKAKWALGRLKWIQGTIGRLKARAEEVMHHWIGRMGKGMLLHRAGLVQGLRKAFEGLKHAFKAGWISNSTYRNALMNLQQKIKDLLNSPNIPAPVKQGLKQLMSEISHELGGSETSNSVGSHGEGSGSQGGMGNVGGSGKGSKGKGG